MCVNCLWGNNTSNSIEGGELDALDMCPRLITVTSINQWERTMTEEGGEIEREKKREEREREREMCLCVCDVKSSHQEEDDDNNTKAGAMEHLQPVDRLQTSQRSIQSSLLPSPEDVHEDKSVYEARAFTRSHERGQKCLKHIIMSDRPCMCN
jgi:hypothetical protein